MSNGNNVPQPPDGVSTWAKDLGYILFMSAGLITGVTGLVQGCNTRSHVDEHAVKIEQNRDSITKTEDKVVKVEAQAEAAKKVADVIEKKVEKIDKDK